MDDAGAVSQTGDLWLLGKHRLLCGDNTVATDVERVLGGVAPHLMVTDPPYLSRQQASRSFRKHLLVLLQVASGTQPTGYSEVTAIINR